MPGYAESAGLAALFGSLAQSADRYVQRKGEEEQKARNDYMDIVKDRIKRGEYVRTPEAGAADVPLTIADERELLKMLRAGKDVPSPYAYKKKTIPGMKPYSVDAEGNTTFKADDLKEQVAREYAKDPNMAKATYTPEVLDWAGIKQLEPAYVLDENMNPIYTYPAPRGTKPVIKRKDNSFAVLGEILGGLSGGAPAPAAAPAAQAGQGKILVRSKRTGRMGEILPQDFDETKHEKVAR